MGSQNGTDTKPTRDHLELLPQVDRWPVKLFKYRTRCVRGARAVRILPHSVTLPAHETSVSAFS